MRSYAVVVLLAMLGLGGILVGAAVTVLGLHAWLSERDGEH